MTAMGLSREEKIEKLEWNSGSCGFEVCEFDSIIGEMDRPGPDRPDLKSIVAVSGPSDKYTDEELDKIFAFSERITACYDEMFCYRRGANLFLLDKEGNGLWMRKRLTWRTGHMHSKTLDEALVALEK